MPIVFKGSVVLLKHYLFKLKTASFEKTVPYMYLDSQGHLMVGIGHNIDLRGDLLDLPFVTTDRFDREAAKDGEKGTPIMEKKVPNRPATPQEIENDASFLKEHLGLENYPPDDLAKYTTLELAPDAIEDLFLTDLNLAYDSLLNEFGFAQFLAFAVPCQAGLIDLAFSTGDIRGFPNLVRAVKGRENSRASRCAIDGRRPQGRAIGRSPATSGTTRSCSGLPKERY